MRGELADSCKDEETVIDFDIKAMDSNRHQSDISQLLLGNWNTYTNGLR